MPIEDYAFENGIFYCREYGSISKDDALEWAKYIRYYAKIHPSPIVSLIDATEVTHIDNEARRIFANVSATPNYALAAVATNTLISEFTARIVNSTALDPHSHLFKSIDLARAFAEQKARDFNPDK